MHKSIKQYLDHLDTGNPIKEDVVRTAFEVAQEELCQAESENDDRMVRYYMNLCNDLQVHIEQIETGWSWE